MSAADVVTAAKRAGIKVDANYVHKVRGGARICNAIDMADKRPTRANEELVEASRHLNYEFHTFTVALRGVIVMQQPSSIETLTLLTQAGAALFESFAIHARSLMHFAYPAYPIYPNDILAEDYIPEWETVRPPMAPALSNVKGRVAAEFAHLSYRRIPLTEAAMKWQVSEIANGLLDVMRAFLANVLPEKVDPALLLKVNPKDSAIAPGTIPLMGMPQWPHKK